jgi:hypothetical protein
VFPQVKKCSKERHMGKKLTIEEIKTRAKDVGTWEVLDHVYMDAHTKLKCKCIKCGYIHSVTGNHIQQGTGCPRCLGVKKPTIGEIKKHLKNAGIWELLDNVYLTKRSKLLCKCILNGHRHYVSWDSLRQGSGCPYCNRGTTANNLKHNIDYIRKDFAKEGYILLTKTYENTKQKLEYICSSPEKHHHSTTWGVWRGGHRCPYCHGNARLTTEFVRLEFAKEGYFLISDYTNAYTKLTCICPRGCVYITTWAYWNANKRCPCFSKYRNRPTTASISSEVEKEGYRLVSEYKDNATPLHLICKNDHNYYVSWNNWYSRKHGCPLCKILTIGKIKKFAKKAGIWTVVDDGYYKDCTSKLKCKCVKRGHFHMVSWSQIQQGAGCPFCNKNGKSKWEKEVKSFISKSNIDYVPNDRTHIVNPLSC